MRDSLDYKRLLTSLMEAVDEIKLKDLEGSEVENDWTSGQASAILQPK